MCNHFSLLTLLFLCLLYKLQLACDHFFCLWLSHLSRFPELTWKHMLCASRFLLIKHICRTPKSQPLYTNPLAIGRGGLLPPSMLHKIDPEHSSPCTCQLRWKHTGLLGKQLLLHRTGVYTSSGLWLLSVRNDSSAFCCSVAFLRITRTNEGLITAAWALFVCFCAPVLFLPHMAILSLGLSSWTQTHTYRCTRCTHNSQPSEIPVCRNYFW